MKPRKRTCVIDVDGETIAMLLDMDEKARLVDEYVAHLDEEEKDAILADVFDANHRPRIREFYGWLERRAREDDTVAEMVREAEDRERTWSVRRKNTDPDDYEG